MTDLNVISQGDVLNLDTVQSKARYASRGSPSQSVRGLLVITDSVRTLEYPIFQRA